VADVTDRPGLAWLLQHFAEREREGLEVAAALHTDLLVKLMEARRKLEEWERQPGVCIEQARREVFQPVFRLTLEVGRLAYMLAYGEAMEEEEGEPPILPPPRAN